jgi:hypothetical protein
VALVAVISSGIVGWVASLVHGSEGPGQELAISGEAAHRDRRFDPEGEAGFDAIARRGFAALRRLRTEAIRQPQSFRRAGGADRRRSAILAFLFFVIVVAACGGEEGKAEAPPWGLDAVVLPRDAASLRALAEALPAEVAGRALADRELLTGARYGERYTAPGKPDAFVGAVIRENVEGFEPGMTAAGYLELLAREFEKDGFEGAPVEIEARALDVAGALVYLVWNSTRDGQPWYAASWAEPDGDWLFSVSADTAEARAALVAAFAEATSLAAS